MSSEWNLLPVIIFYDIFFHTNYFFYSLSLFLLWLLYFAISLSQYLLGFYWDPIPETYQLICIFLMYYLWLSNSFSISRSRLFINSHLNVVSRISSANCHPRTTLTLARWSRYILGRSRCRMTRCGFGRAAKMTLTKRDLVRYRSVSRCGTPGCVHRFVVGGSRRELRVGVPRPGSVMTRSRKRAEPGLVYASVRGPPVFN